MENDTQVCDLSWNTSQEEEDDSNKTPVAVLTINAQKLLIYSGKKYTVGRGPKASLVVPVKSLSREHVEIQHLAGSHLIKDLKSKNKTKRGQLVLQPEVMYELLDMSRSHYTLLLADTPAYYHYITEKGREKDWLGDGVSESQILPSHSSTPAKALQEESHVSYTVEEEPSSDAECMPASQFVPNIDQSADLLYVEDSPQNSPLKHDKHPVTMATPPLSNVPETPAATKVARRTLAGVSLDDSAVSQVCNPGNGADDSVNTTTDQTSILNREKELAALNLMLESNNPVSAIPESQVIDLNMVDEGGSECGSAIVDLQEEVSGFVIAETQRVSKTTVLEAVEDQDTQCWDMELTTCHSTHGRADRTELSMLGITIGSQAPFSPLQSGSSCIDRSKVVESSDSDMTDIEPDTEDDSSKANLVPNDSVIIEAPALSVSDIQNSVDAGDETRRSRRLVAPDNQAPHPLQPEDSGLWQTILEQSISEVDEDSIAKTPPPSPPPLETQPAPLGLMTPPKLHPIPTESQIERTPSPPPAPLQQHEVAGYSTPPKTCPIPTESQIERTPSPHPVPTDSQIEKTPSPLKNVPQIDRGIERTPPQVTARDAPTPPGSDKSTARALTYGTSREEELIAEVETELASDVEVETELASDVEGTLTTNSPEEALVQDGNHGDGNHDNEGTIDDQVATTTPEIVNDADDVPNVVQPSNTPDKESDIPVPDTSQPSNTETTGQIELQWDGREDGSSTDDPDDGSDGDDIAITLVQDACSLEITAVHEEDSVNFVEQPCTLELDVAYCGEVGDFAVKDSVKDEPASQGGVQKAFMSMFDPIEGDEEQPETQAPDTCTDFLNNEKVTEIINKEPSPIKGGGRGRPRRSVTTATPPSPVAGGGSSRGKGRRRKQPDVQEQEEEEEESPVAGGGSSRGKGRRRKQPDVQEEEEEEEESPEAVRIPAKRAGRGRKKRQVEEEEEVKSPERTTVLKLEGVENLLRKRRQLKQKREEKASKFTHKRKRKAPASGMSDEDEDLPDFGGLMDAEGPDSDSDDIVEIDLLTSNMGRRRASPVADVPVSETRKRKTSGTRIDTVKKAKEAAPKPAKSPKAAPNQPIRAQYTGHVTAPNQRKPASNQRKRVLSSSSESGASELVSPPGIPTIDSNHGNPTIQETEDTEIESIVASNHGNSDSDASYKPAGVVESSQGKSYKPAGVGESSQGKRRSRRRTDSSSTTLPDSLSSTATRSSRRTIPVAEPSLPDAPPTTSKRGRVQKIKPAVQAVLSEVPRPKRGRKVKSEVAEVKPVVRSKRIKSESGQENVKPNVAGKQRAPKETPNSSEDNSLVIVAGSRKRKKVSSPVKPAVKITNYLPPAAADRVASPRRAAVEKPRQVHIVYTGIPPSDLNKRTIAGLGGVLSEEISDKCTHLVTDKIKRTAKFLCAIGRGIPIVSEKWITQSKACKAFVDAHDFMVKDKATEKQYKFVLTKSLEKARVSPFLTGWRVYVTKNCKPDPQQIAPILASNGGTLLRKAPRKGDTHVLILATEQDNLPALRRSGAPVCSTELVLTGALRQELCVPEFTLGEIEF